MKIVFHLAVLGVALMGLTGCGRAKTDSPPPAPVGAVTAGDATASPAVTPVANEVANFTPASGVAAEAGRVDVSGVESAFRGAVGGAKQEADQAVALARAGNYLDAWAHAQKAMIKYPTTAPQKQALVAMSAQLKPLLPPL